ncbi:hypothetical protein Nepgr_023738 [Nepenthes gracilis]|uniref:NAC domain-containing protein n=1 Tax=Nepenthes gracilis TaxID=150966 RepID=A0AAD3T313_NEPGR|nr:hypothetical protein Nepgr_023738 [Nepenthes gracilis]
MENVSGCHGEEEAMELPPGFRFYPTDEELITHYLSPKVLDRNFSSRAFGEVDLNKCEPWDLPRRAKMGEKEWYFFCVKDRKYPTGLRTNRATAAGYWKTTGKDREIYRGKSLVGMKKTLVFYKGRAPKGEKSNWVMHEYRLEGKFSLKNNHPATATNEWVICRVFHRNSDGKKICYPGTMRSHSFGTQFGASSGLPPLMESSPYGDQTKPAMPGSAHVSCFSSPAINNAQRSHQQIFDSFNNNLYKPQRNSTMNTFYESQIAPIPGNFISDQEILSRHLDNNNNKNSSGSLMKQRMKTERDVVSVFQDTCLTSDMHAGILSVYEMGKGILENQEAPSTSGWPFDIDGFWSY